MKITLQTITSIELSNVCNYSCMYCINRDIKNQSNRDCGIMDDNTFGIACVILEQLIKKGTQKEIWLNGNGESLLDPLLISRTITIKRIMGNLQVGLSTNGALMTIEIAKGLKAAGIDRVDISCHKIEDALKARKILWDNGITAGLSIGILSAPHNWAGQVPGIPCKLKDVICLPLLEGRGYVQKEGNISPCCYDYRNLGTFGSVFDANILDKPIRPYKLCETCHQNIPEIIKNNIE